MWNVKIKKVPIIIGASETISKSLKKTSEQHIWKT
jgi:hypothetical protein